MQIADLENKKILILGFGREGKDSYFVLRKLFPNKIIGIADKKRIRNYELGIRNKTEKNKNLKTHFGENYLAEIKNYDVIIRTPGISIDKIKPFVKRGSKITSQTELFFNNFKGVVIGITGTKGKGTTSSLIYSILKKAGIKSSLVGNIGKPVLGEMLKSKQGEIFVYELSDHQLQGLKKSPHIAVFLNLFRDHLDYYKTEEKYQKAKENITRWQGKGDWLIYNADDKKVKQIAKNTKAKTIAFSLKTTLTDFERSLESCYQLKGQFNVSNLLAAVRVGQLLGIPKEKIKQGIQTFKGLPHRLEFVGKYKGIEFYDDSMSTIPEVTIAALRAFKGRVGSLIVGGSEKGSDYKELGKEIIKNKVKTLIILFPGTGKKIWENCYKLGRSAFAPQQARGYGLDKSSQIVTKKVEVKSMKEAVKAAYDKTNKGEVCLLSPGAASFNLFTSYAERGDLFKEWVRYYGKK